MLNNKEEDDLYVASCIRIRLAYVSYSYLNFKQANNSIYNINKEGTYTTVMKNINI